LVGVSGIYRDLYRFSLSQPKPAVIGEKKMQQATTPLRVGKRAVRKTG